MTDGTSHEPHWRIQEGRRERIRITRAHVQSAKMHRMPTEGTMLQGEGRTRTIKVNHHLNEFKEKARKLLTSKEGLKHRNRRPIESEAVFGQIKYDGHYRRFRHKEKDKVYMDFAIFAMSSNLRKLIRNAAERLTERYRDNKSAQNGPRRPLFVL